MAAETIKVQADLRGFQKWAARAVGRQVPFATAKALTKTALEARDAVRAGLPARFEIRSTWTARGVTINPASKSDYPNAYAEVGTRHEWMVLQETGGAKAPKDLGANGLWDHRLNITCAFCNWGSSGFSATAAAMHARA